MLCGQLEDGNAGPIFTLPEFDWHLYAVCKRCEMKMNWWVEYFSFWSFKFLIVLSNQLCPALHMTPWNVATCCIPWDGDGMPMIRASGRLILELVEHLRLKFKVAEVQQYLHYSDYTECWRVVVELKSWFKSKNAILKRPRMHTINWCVGHRIPHGHHECSIECEDSLVHCSSPLTTHACYITCLFPVRFLSARVQYSWARAQLPFCTVWFVMLIWHLLQCILKGYMCVCW
jgi:hypothetical protein